MQADHQGTTTVTDERTFTLVSETWARDRSCGLSPRSRVLKADGSFVKPPFFQSDAVYHIINLLWLDVGEGLPWTPSAIETVVCEREFDIIEYRRGPS